MKRTGTAQWMENQNRWQIKVQKDGERRTFTSSKPGRNGQREANAKADAWLDDNISDENVRVEKLYSEYVESLKLTTSKSNWVKIESIGKNWILAQVGKRKVGSLNEHDFQTVIDKAYAGGLSRKSLSNIRATIMNFLKYCRKRKATTLMLEDLSIPKGARAQEKRILQPADLKKVFSCNETELRGKRVPDEYVNAYRFQLLTGLRPGELMGLEWSDIEGDMLYVKRAINYYGETTQGKNENAIRHFVLSDKAKEILRQQKELSSSNSIFGIDNQITYRKRWIRYCESNQIPPISLYEMRHTFVSIAKQLPEGKVKPLIGHSQNMDTFGIYGHEVNGELEETAKSIDRLFTEIIKSK